MRTLLQSVKVWRLSKKAIQAKELLAVMDREIRWWEAERAKAEAEGERLSRLLSDERARLAVMRESEILRRERMA
jgi:hypothetical protein